MFEVQDPPSDTKSGARFSEDEVAAFKQAGFVIARRIVPEEIRQAMLEATQAGLTGPILPVEYEADLRYPGAPVRLDAQGGRTIRRLKQALGRHPVFTDWVSGEPLAGRLRQLLGPRVVLPLAHHNCIMTKQPRFSSETHWHQDIRYWSYERPELVSVWLALGREVAENGCLSVLPGTHRMNFSGEQLDAELFFREDLPENAALIAGRVQAELEPGDVLFFHARTLHAAGRNLTHEPKFSVVFTFRPADNLPLPGSRSSALPELWLPASKDEGGDGRMKTEG